MLNCTRCTPPALANCGISVGTLRTGSLFKSTQRCLIGTPVNYKEMYWWTSREWKLSSKLAAKNVVTWTMQLSFTLAAEIGEFL